MMCHGSFVYEEGTCETKLSRSKNPIVSIQKRLTLIPIVKRVNTYIQLFVRGREYLKSPLQVYLTCTMLSRAAASKKIAKHFTYELTRRLVQVVNIFLWTAGSTNSNFKVVLCTFCILPWEQFPLNKWSSMKTIFDFFPISGSLCISIVIFPLFIANPLCVWIMVSHFSSFLISKVCKWVG